MAGNNFSLSSLASTASWTAAVRAMENLRPDRLFEDPWAQALAGDVGAAWISGRTPESVVPIVLRTRFFDDFLSRVTGEHRVRQIVLVGAGMDTRAFRLAWPAGTTIYELDQAAVLESKERVLEAAGVRPGCRRSVIHADLTQPWTRPLLEAGYAPTERSGWLLEGFLFYLPSETVPALLGQVTDLTAESSWLGFDIINGEMLTSPLTRPWIEMQKASGAPWIGSMDDPVGFLAGEGWRAWLSQAGQPEANYGRWPYPVVPTDMPGMPHNWFVVARKEGPPSGS